MNLRLVVVIGGNNIMAQYISKSALAAEIEKRVTEGEKVTKEIPSSAIMGLIQAYKNTLSFIDTLEVKEVDLEREIDKELAEEWYGEYIDLEKFKRTAKHFYELGLKAQKGE